MTLQQTLKDAIQALHISTAKLLMHDTEQCEKNSDVLTELRAALDGLEGDYIKIITAASAIIGYTSSLKDGQTINQDYLDRLESYYVANLEAAIKAIKEAL